MVSRGRLTVVLADDHRPMLEAVTRIVNVDCEIVAAVSHGISALRAVACHEPDLAVLDISMPGMNGLDVAREINKRRLRTKVVFLTSFSDSDYAEAAKALNAGYVLKSRMHCDLLAAIKNILSERPMRTARRYRLCVPITVWVTAPGPVVAHSGRTSAISPDGAYFVLGCSFEPRTELGFTITLSAAVTGGNNILIRGVARVLRADPIRESDFGIATVFERYELCRR